jgi:hypothetical protein
LTEGFECATCGKQHQGLPRSFAADFPDMYANLTREERDTRTIIGSDQYVVDQLWFFIRGCLEIPVAGSSEPFLWGLWASVLEPAFDEISETWEKDGREKAHGPFKGRLANSLSVYAETFNLKVSIAIQPVGTRPLFIVDEAEHPLAIEQRNGISQNRVQELASLLLHQERLGWPAKFT